MKKILAIGLFLIGFNAFSGASKIDDLPVVPQAGDFGAVEGYTTGRRHTSFHITQVKQSNEV